MSEPRKWEVKKNKEESRFEVKRKGFCNCHWGEGSCDEKERREERKKAVKSLYVYSYIWFSSDFLEIWTLPDTQQEFTRHLLNASVGKSQWSGPDDCSPKTASIAPPYKKFKWCILHAIFSRSPGCYKPLPPLLTHPIISELFRYMCVPPLLNLELSKGMVPGPFMSASLMTSCTGPGCKLKCVDLKVPIFKTYCLTSSLKRWNFKRLRKLFSKQLLRIYFMHDLELEAGDPESNTTQSLFQGLSVYGDKNISN